MVTVNGEWVEFSFYRPQARKVNLAGDFNDWNPSNLPMRSGPDGYWIARMKLPAGEFQFRYCADGQWHTDYAAFGVEPTDLGLNSICRVSATPKTVSLQTSTDSLDTTGQYVAA
ncbi:MAG: isoamylase early set domain-containing protein [Planctomycetota bacterium]